MNRRRMMMGEGFFTVVLDFDEVTDEKVRVIYGEAEYRGGILKCKKDDILICCIGNDKGKSGIYLNGESIELSFANPDYRHTVLSSVFIKAVGGKMYITTK